MFFALIQVTVSSLNILERPLLKIYQLTAVHKVKIIHVGLWRKLHTTIVAHVHLTRSISRYRGNYNNSISSPCTIYRSRSGIFKQSYTANGGWINTGERAFEWHSVYNDKRFIARCTVAQGCYTTNKKVVRAHHRQSSGCSLQALHDVGLQLTFKFLGRDQGESTCCPLFGERLITRHNHV